MNNKDKEDCIGDLVKLANTAFEKQACIEISIIEGKLREELGKIRIELRWVKYISIAVFLGIVLDIIRNII